MDPIVQSDIQNQSNPDQTTPPVMSPAPKSSVLPFIIYIFLFITVAVVGLLTYQNYNLNKQIASFRIMPSVLPTPSLAPTPQAKPDLTPPATANWKTFTDPSGEFSFKYPTVYILSKLGDSLPLLNRKIYWSTSTISSLNCRGDCPIITSTSHVILNGLEATKIKGWIGEIGGNYAQSYIAYEIKYPNQNKYLKITLWELPQDIKPEEVPLPNRQVGEINKQEEETFDQILSTFKFLDNSTTPTPGSKTTYIAPTSWKKITTQDDLKLCLPPKWESDSAGHVIFNREEGYKPDVTYITNIPYSGGSRREAYFAYWVKEYPNVKQLVSVTDTDINGASALTIYPANSVDPKTSPEGLTVVWYAGGKLWKAGLSGWNMINDSQTSFLKDFYTMTSCSF